MGPGMMVGMLLGALAGMLLGVLLVSRSGAGSMGKVALSIPAALLGGLSLAMAGLVAGLAVDLLVARASPLGQGYASFSALQALPLYQAACAKDLRKVQQLIAQPLDDATRRRLPEIAHNCTGTYGGDLPADADIFKALMPLAYVQYRQGQVRADEDLRVEDYCDILDRLISSLQAEKLGQVRALGLPVHCRDGSAHMRLESFMSFGADLHDAALLQARRTALVALIGGKDGPISQARAGDGSSLLDRAVTTGDLFFVILALEAGTDAGRPSPVTDVPPVLQWTLRKLRTCFGVSCNTDAAADIDAVDRLMPAPTAAQINTLTGKRWPQPFLSQLADLRDTNDGGAAFFRYLKQHGANLGVTRSTHPGLQQSVLAGLPIKPALMTELEDLTPAELAQLAHPLNPATGAPGETLLRGAMREKNEALVDFLCRRGVDGCQNKAAAGLQN